MRAMLLDRPKTPLRYDGSLPEPKPGPGEILIRVVACGVCRTDLHVVDGELPNPKLPIIPGHEIVGRVERTGDGAQRFSVGERIGIPWLGWTDGRCAYCTSGRENLCDRPRFTGYTIDGGYADYAVADERYCFSIPGAFEDIAAAPLLCAGLIGHRSLRLADDGRNLGLYGFGASAHIVAQVAVYRGQRVFAFTKPGDVHGQDFSKSLGACWAGDSTQQPPEQLDAAIIFAPVGSLVPTALAATRKGGTVVCAGIHMSEIPSFPYELLWGERVVRSVANLTRADGDEFLALAPKIPVRTTTRPVPLNEANDALRILREGKVEGALVLVP